MISSQGAGDRECRLPTKGVYEAIYDKEFRSVYSPFILELDTNFCKITDRGSSSRFKIVDFDKCEWHFQNEASLDTSKLTELEEQLNSMGKPFYEIKMLSKRKFRFTLRRNMHIVIN